MLRIAFTRSAGAVRFASPRSSSSATRLISQRRCESSTTSDERRKRLEASDDLRRDWDARVITYEELQEKTTQPSPEKYLIDVREPDEVLQGSIPSSVNLPLPQLASAFQLSPEQFRDMYGFEKPRPNQEVTFYCRSGVRSTTASDVAKRNGYKNVLNYKGSWLEWTERQGKKP